MSKMKLSMSIQGLCLFLSVPVTGQENTIPPLAAGWAVGGSAGVVAVSGTNFQNFNPGPGGGIEALYLDARGFGFRFFADGAIHPGANDFSPMLMGWLGIEPRWTPLVGRRTVTPFVGARLAVGAWGFDVPNPITLENTTVNAFGGNAGPTLGVLGAVTERIDVGVVIAYAWMSFGNAETEAFVFDDTETKGQRFSLSFVFHIRQPNF